METRAYSSTLEKSTIIERVARIVSSVRGAKADYTRLASELEQAIPFDIFGVVLLQHDRQAVRVTVCHRDEQGAWAAAYHQHPCEDSKFAQVLQDPTLIITNYPEGLDGPPAVSGDALSGYHQLRSMLIAPLLIEDQVFGTLELGSMTPDTYGDESLQRLVSAVARVLAAAIESAQRGGRAAIQDRQREALKDVTTALTSKTDLPTILNQIVVGIAKSLNVASAIIMLDRREGKLRVEAQSGLDAEVLQRLFRDSYSIRDRCIIGQTVQRRQPYVSQDITCDDRFSENCELFSALGLRSIFSYPLAVGTTVYGALLLCSPLPGGFTPLKADILSLFASQATVAIHNGMLLEAVNQRNRFQEAIERLEQAHKRHASGPLRSGNGECEDLEELELLKQVREETQRVFGVSFSSLLRFIGENLLTRNERDVLAVFQSIQGKQSLEFADSPHCPPETTAQKEKSEKERQAPLAGAASLLVQTAESALVRAGMLGELGRLVVQLKQSSSGVKDAWFIVDLQGYCTYMNPAAEALCGVRMGDLPSAAYANQLLPATAVQGQQPAMTVEEVFTGLLPRMRNAEEVQMYLRDFSQGSIYRQELRCVLAPAPLQSSALNEHPLRVESVPADDHYHFTRYPLYNVQEQLEANALQVQDVSEQVRDEKNRSALLSSVSHDLRTPLTTIKAAVTGLLQEDVAWSEQDRRAMLEDIDSETDHLTVLVNAIVELSRIEMGALILEKEWCDVIEVFYGALARVQRILGERPVRTEFQPHLPLIYVDHVQLERVFSNLLENAVFNSPPDTGIAVLIDRLSEPPGSPEKLRVRVVDHGEGVPEYERERIFKSFYSLRPYGNGLGLAICRGIIEAHQGEIRVDPSVADGGACFVFTLPTHPHTIVRADTGSASIPDRGLPEDQKDHHNQATFLSQAQEPVEEDQL